MFLRDKNISASIVIIMSEIRPEKKEIQWLQRKVPNNFYQASYWLNHLFRIILLYYFLFVSYEFF